MKSRDVGYRDRGRYNQRQDLCSSRVLITRATTPDAHPSSEPSTLLRSSSSSAEGGAPAPWYSLTNPSPPSSSHAEVVSVPCHTLPSRRRRRTMAKKTSTLAKPMDARMTGDGDGDCGRMTLAIVARCCFTTAISTRRTPPRSWTPSGRSSWCLSSTASRRELKAVNGIDARETRGAKVIVAKHPALPGGTLLAAIGASLSTAKLPKSSARAQLPCGCTSTDTSVGWTPRRLASASLSEASDPMRSHAASAK